MNALPKKLLVPCTMKRVICHWSEGNYKANSTDLEHYHILIEGDGTVRGGDHSIADNVSTSDGDYAAHTRGANTGAIGVACCCMVGCNEKPFKPGAQPLKKTQWEVMVQVVAELCQFYNIPVTPETVLGHGEVQGTLGIKQLGKWDPMVWPWDTSKTRAQVGAALREQVTAALATLSPASAKKPAAPPPVKTTLNSVLLAGDATLRRIAQGALVLVKPEQPKLVEGIAPVQDALNLIAKASPAVPAISFGTNNQFRGWFGAKTEAAVIAFQKLSGLSTDGKIGKETLRALDDALIAGGLGGTGGAGKTPLKDKAKPAAAGSFVKTLAKVHNRGIPPVSFLQELVQWGKTAAKEIFTDRDTKEKDVYASVQEFLGPYGKLIHRKACMLEIMRVLAGFESSWKWNTGQDTSNPDENSPDTISAGPFQVSSNSLVFGQDLKDLVAPFGITKPKLHGDAFQKLMKTNHTVAFNYIARLLRHTIRHNGPVKRGEINKWLSRDAVAEFEKLLKA
jgi:peptidoglycan hydrolase-like protein with peptidoglycan-binding domain